MISSKNKLNSKINWLFNLESNAHEEHLYQPRWVLAKFSFRNLLLLVELIYNS